MSAAQATRPGLLAGDGIGARLARHSLWLVVLAALAIPLADLEVLSRDPWGELGRMAMGLALPDFGAIETPLQAIGLTIAVAFWGTLAGVVLGLPLALVYARSRLVRAASAAVRAVHELFWALLFLQVFGLSALTALAALAIPYAGIFAKVYAEILEQTPQAPQAALPEGTGRLARLAYTELPQAFAQLAAYTRYRFECALRSSVLLGFVGLPTLGYQLESAFREGRYFEAGALLWAFYLLVATLPWWAHRRLLLPLGLASVWLLGPWPEIDPGLLWRFVSVDIWPRALLEGDIGGVLRWLAELPDLVGAVANTLLLGLLGTVGALLLALVLWPLASRHFGNRVSQGIGQGLLIFLRSTPELMLAFVFLLLLGPSLLPAWLALALHNGALIAFLVCRHAQAIEPGMPGLPASGRLAYELLPRLYPGMLALVYYRAEVILRESALLGMLGVATLGDNIDDAFQTLMFDVAFALLVITALLNIAVDALARRLRPCEPPMEDPCLR
ncbi:ABC transporter permease [Halomonas litopenaei]|uniref:ABC transporter permease n=2 Tax=Halomonas TaxID=2745 RepID=A0AAU7KK22_9GAMM|nr:MULTISPECIES: ABC transporter permease subunit [Halomonas]PTL92801.1 ABC transporter permease [Halomonas sp. SYSU XM8]PTL96295.1 ABC transporter permease [Halomonas litopenaei]